MTQAQYSLYQQLIELKTLANFSGLYDAADFVQQELDRMVEESNMTPSKVVINKH
jgi:hypothetical protein